MLQIIDKDPSYFDKRYQKEARDSINSLSCGGNGLIAACRMIDGFILSLLFYDIKRGEYKKGFDLKLLHLNYAIREIKFFIF